MKLSHAIILAHEVAAGLRRELLTVGSDALNYESNRPRIVKLTEQAAAIEGLAKFAASLLKPAPSADIASAIVDRVMGLHDRTMAALRDDPRGDVEKLDRVGQEMLARAMRTPGEHMHEAGKRGVKS